MEHPLFISEPADDYPGWHSWALRDDTRFNGAILGRLLLRQESEGKAWVRMFPEHRHSNFADNIHGGTLLGFIDVALFGASHRMGILPPAPSVTLDLSVQFIGAGKINIPLDAEVELLKETGRLLFLRGLVVQNGNSVASFSGTVRKGSVPKA